MTDLDIPAFLRIPQDVRNACWKGRRVRSLAGTQWATPIKPMDPATKAFVRELQKQAKAKQAAKFAMLRERAAEKKRQAVKP